MDLLYKYNKIYKISRHCVFGLALQNVSKDNTVCKSELYNTILYLHIRAGTVKYEVFAREIITK